MEIVSKMDKLHINVDITSDVVCPWCWIGKRHLDSAIRELSSEFVFHILWKPFLLNPHTPSDGVPLEQHIRGKFGDSAAKKFLSGESPVALSGKAVGICFTPHRLVVPTKKAHLLLAHAANEGKQHELHEVLFRAYFADGMNISNDEVLSTLVGEVGLDRERAMAALEDTQLVQNYEEEVTEARRKGITGVPHFEIYLKDKPGMRQSVSGAQPIDTFIALFRRLRLPPKV